MLLAALLLTASPVERAAKWMAAFPVEELRYDAAVGLSQVLKVVDSPELRDAYARARTLADRDTDHPQRRFLEPDAGVVAKRAVHSWSATDAKVNLNRPIDEALWCDVHGLRAQSLAYASGPMRDAGGYRSTHALWALVIARDRRCLDEKAFTKTSAAVRAELRRTQPPEPGPSTSELDLYGERLLFLLLAGERDAMLTAWGEKLAKRQNADGSFGSPGERRYEQYHATLVATWALALLDAH
jgi:hypothetical protein